MARPSRFWIDTDAGCGANSQTDPDGRVAIAWLVSQGFSIPGTPKSFGSTTGAEVEQNGTRLVKDLTQSGPEFLCRPGRRTTDAGDKTALDAYPLRRSG